MNELKDSSINQSKLQLATLNTQKLSVVKEKNKKIELKFQSKLNDNTIQEVCPNSNNHKNFFLSSSIYTEFKEIIDNGSYCDFICSAICICKKTKRNYAKLKLIEAEASSFSNIIKGLSEEILTANLLD
jgi:hypothetical protein